MRQIIKAKIARAQAEHEMPGGQPEDESGLVLLDPTLTPIAFDRGAATILSYPDRVNSIRSVAECIPSEIMTAIRSRKPGELSSFELHFRRGARQYFCRAFLVETTSRPPALLFVALHLERERSDSNAFRELGNTYNLTKREQEALGYLSLGFTSKEVAQQMDISPQTVKGFLRGIMAKMGVVSRGEILARLLQHNSPAMRKQPNCEGVVRGSAQNE